MLAVQAPRRDDPSFSEPKERATRKKPQLKKESLTVLTVDELRSAAGAAITTNCTLYCTLDFDACIPSNSNACTRHC